MSEGWLIVILAVISILLLVRYLTLRSFLRELLDSVSHKRNFIPTTNFSVVAKKLTREFNDFLDEFKEAETGKDGKETVISQLEVALMNLTESVILIDEDRNIRFINEAAKGWMAYRTGSIVGRTIEDVFRSAELIEFVYALIQGKLGIKGQETVKIQRNGNGVHWFEVTGAKIDDQSQDKLTYLLVMHDITQLKALEAVRKDFVANVSHELRTPITVIKGFTEALVEDQLSESMKTKFIDKTYKNVQRLNLLIEDLLILSRLESGAHTAVADKISLDDLCVEVAENYNLQKKYSQPIVFDERAEPAYIIGNRNQFIQILENIIENSYRYAGDFTEITITIEKDIQGDSIFWKCVVSDDGVGIPKKDQSRVFERFYRVDQSRSTLSGGTGLGLSIVKHIIQLSGGKVAIESEEGKGTSVIIHLPAVIENETGE